MKFLIVVLILFCCSCASNQKTLSISPKNANQSCHIVLEDEVSRDNREKTKECEPRSQEMPGAYIQAAISIGILFALIL